MEKIPSPSKFEKLPLELVEKYFKDLNNTDFLELRKINKDYKRFIDNYLQKINKTTMVHNGISIKHNK